MPEALTESFCERCGTRYEFAAPTRLNTLRKTRGLISGLRNYIMSQDTLSDAVGDAIRSEEETLAAQQLEAFHESFNFCIQCRQYACMNCWNDGAGRCRSCVPIPGTDDLIERFEASFSAQRTSVATAEEELQADELNRRLGVEAWPSTDLPAAELNGHVPVEWPAETLPGAAPEPEPAVAEAEAEPEPEPLVAEVEFEPETVVAEAEPEPEPVAAFEAELEPAVAEAELSLPATVPAESEFVAPDEPEWPAAPPAPEPTPALTWEEDATFELEPEPEPILAEVEREPEPVAAEIELEPEPVVAEPEPEPVVAEVDLEPEPEPEPVAAFEAEPTPPEPSPPAVPRPIVPISETILHIPRREPAPEAEPLAAEQEDPALAARRAKLEQLGLGDPGQGPVTAEPKVLPYRSSGAAVHSAELAARTAAGAQSAGVGSFWEASAREVAGAMTSIGVQACGECGLSLSASARFCRRCGTRQARTA